MTPTHIKTPIIIFDIERFDGREKYRQQYKIEIKPGDTLLSVLINIRDNHDSTLNFTASCRSAICGSCGVYVNGSSVLACETKVEELVNIWQTDTLTIGPLKNYKVINDLVVDWDGKTKRIKMGLGGPGFVPRAEFSEKEGCRQNPDDMQEILPKWDCILCGCCASDCSKLTDDSEDFLEPYIYTTANRNVRDSRASKNNHHHHLKVAGKEGLWNCFYCQRCVAACPKGVEPAEDIANLRESAVQAGYTEGAGPRHALAFLKDMETTGRLDEMKLGTRTEGALKGASMLPMALTMLLKGRLNPLQRHRPVDGHNWLKKMFKAADAGR